MRKRLILTLLVMAAGAGLGCGPAVGREPAAPTAATIGGCPMFPADNIWNTPADTLPVHPNSTTYVNAIGADANVHADFGSGTWEGFKIGIPFNVVPSGTPKVKVTFRWPGESDKVGYPIPKPVKIEGDPKGSGDRHILIVEKGTCKLYELFAARKVDGVWRAGSGAVFNLNSHALRTNGWTSADAAGLPILPGLARYGEVAAGEITHALRFTAPETANSYVWPARHEAGCDGCTDADYPPLGLRFRLKASFNIDDPSYGFSPHAKVILRALKKYGMILADNGSSWYISGAPSPNWNNDVLHELDVVVGSDFEAVDSSGLMISPDSGQAQQPAAGN